MSLLCEKYHERRMGSPLAFLPILLMLMGALAVGIVLLGLNALLGRKIRTKRKLSPFESGMPLLDDSHKRISVKFFIVAMIFILFDVEADEDHRDDEKLDADAFVAIVEQRHAALKGR